MERQQNNNISNDKPQTKWLVLQSWGYALLPYNYKTSIPSGTTAGLHRARELGEARINFRLARSSTRLRLLWYSAKMRPAKLAVNVELLRTYVEIT